MLHLEHLNLVVKDIEKTLHFYQAACPHWQVRGEGNATWSDKPRRWLHFGDDYQYLTFNDNGESNNRDLKGHQIGLAHFAFVTSNIEALTARLINAGYEIANPGAKSAYRKNVYFIDPNNFEVEFVEYLSDEPKLRNIYEE